MQLYFNPASPYVRKVRVTAHELGLADEINLISVSLTPVSPHEGVRSSNPIGKIPALITDDGAALYDSPVSYASISMRAPAAIASSRQPAPHAGQRCAANPLPTASWTPRC